MASPATVAPDRLPAGFDFSKPITIPDRLPADFDFSTPPHEAHAAAARQGGEKPAFIQPEGWALVRAAKGAGDVLGPQLRMLAEAMGAHFSGRGVTPEMAQSMSDAMQAHIDQYGKAKQALKDGNHSEAFGHMLAAGLPFIGPAAAHAAERMGGDAPEFDRYGNVVKSGHAPDIAGGVGEGAALLGEVAAPAAVDAARAPAVAVRRGAGTFAKSMADASVSKPGAAVGAAAGGTVGYKLGGPVGMAAGGAAGAAIGGKVLALRGAMARAIDSMATGYQMATNSPRPAPAWMSIPAAEEVVAPPVEPIRATAFPSGRVPGNLRRPTLSAVAAPPDAATPAITSETAAPPPRTEVIQPTQPVAAEAGPVVAPKRTLAQTEADMLRKKPAEIDPKAAQSAFDENGERKSPQLRAAEITAHNADAKAQRFAEAFHAEGITPEDVGNMTKADAEVMTNGLIAKGILKPGEMPPNQSLPLIKKHLMRLAKGSPQPAPTPAPSSLNPRARAIAEQLAAEMGK